MPINYILEESHIFFMSVHRSKIRKQKVGRDEKESEVDRNPLPVISICTLIYYTMNLLITLLLAQIFHINKEPCTYIKSYTCKYFCQINYYK